MAAAQQRCSSTDATSTEHVVLQLETEGEAEEEAEGWPRVVGGVRLSAPGVRPCGSSTHVCVFVHGLLGHATDLQLWRNYMLTLNPQVRGMA